MLKTAILLLISTTHATITDCSKGTSLFKLNAAAFWPDPAVRNENSTVSLDFTVPPGTLIESGTVKYSATYNFIPLSPTIEELCPKNTNCPITPGTYNQSSSSKYPDLTGTLVMKSEWFDPNNNLLLCYQVNTKS
jgi:hypothetical protein